MSQRSALISGAGFAGLTLAICLKEMGWEVELVERRRELVPVRGLTLGLQGPAWPALESLRVADVLRARGLPLPFFEVYSAGGGLLRRVDEPERIMAGAVQLFRSDIAEVLAERLGRVSVTLCAQVAALESSGERVRVEVAGETEKFERTVDLVIGADGIHSCLRGLLELGEAREDAAYSLGIMGPTRSQGFRAHFGPGAYLVIAPTRTPVANWVLSRELGAGLRPPTTEEEKRQALQEGLERVGEDPAVAAEAAEVRLIRSLEVHCARWSSRRAVLIGDAAHGLWHASGLGASLAISDATRLAFHLRGEADIGSALAAFEAERQPLVRRARKIAHKNRGLSLPPAWMGPVRDLMVRHMPLFLMAARPLSAGPAEAPLTRVG